MRRRLLVLAALLVLLSGVSRWLQRREQTAPPSVPPVVLVPATLSADGLTALELSTGKTASPQVRLTHAPGQPWQVETLYHAPADPDHLRRVVDALRGLTGEVRATGNRWFPAFRVEEDTALRLVVKQGDLVVCDLLISRSPKSSWVSFVRRRDGDVICAVERNLLGEVADVWGDFSVTPLASAPWADLRVFPVDGSAVESVELAERVNQTWVTRRDRHAPFDPETQGLLVSPLVGWRARTVVDPATQTEAFKTPRWRWLVTAPGGGRWEVEEAAPTKPSGKTPDARLTAVVRRLPAGPYLTMDYSPLQLLREKLLSSPAPKSPTSAPPAAPKKP